MSSLLLIESDCVNYENMSALEACLLRISTNKHTYHIDRCVTLDWISAHCMPRDVIDQSEM